jgi:hypothetical protein
MCGVVYIGLVQCSAGEIRNGAEDMEHVTCIAMCM